jgi:hypothetical protein
VYPGFTMTSGVRQGCPLSPLLYALAADALLEKISKSVDDVWVRAYADDTAIIVTDFWEQAPRLAEVFETFGNLSNLRLNFEKCVIIPLHPNCPKIKIRPDAHQCRTTDPATSPSTSAQRLERGVDTRIKPTSTNQRMESGPLSRFRNTLINHLPLWSTMELAWHGKYLGFMVGPGKGDQSWNGPVAKYEKRCHTWSQHARGMLYSMIAYNTFSISTLSYIAQLESPPGWVYERERLALRKVASGPGQWAKPEDLWHLKDAYGFAHSFKCLDWLSRAAQLRAYRWDPAFADKRGREEEAANLRQLLGCSSMPHTRVVWNDWFLRSFLLRLVDNYKWFSNHVCLVSHMECRIKEQVRDTQRTPPYVKLVFQRTAYDLLCQHAPYDAENRIRAKQERWQLCEDRHLRYVSLSGKRKTPAWQAERTLRNLHELSSLVTPRVWSAVFSTIWNRWTTARRFQQRESSNNVCALGC